MSRHLNLDELAAARAEALGEPPTVEIKGEVFTLPVEMPIAVVEAYRDDADAATFGEAIFGDQWERVKALRPSQKDIWAIDLEALWGVDEGESEASGSSSQTSGDRSRPTSSAGTESTSDTQSGAPTQSVPVGSAR